MFDPNMDITPEFVEELKAMFLHKRILAYTQRGFYKNPYINDAILSDFVYISDITYQPNVSYYNAEGRREDHPTFRIKLYLGSSSNLNPEVHSHFKISSNYYNLLTTFEDLVFSEEVMSKEEMFEYSKNGYQNNLCSLGCDPELFIVDGSGTIVPAFEVMPVKQEEDLVYKDGFQLEFSTIEDEHGTCLDGFLSRIRGSLVRARHIIKTVNNEFTLSSKTAIEVPKEIFDRAPDDEKKFGCSPSINLYGDVPELGTGIDDPLRFTGGHMHFGMKKEKPEVYVRRLDMTVGLLSVALFANYDDPRRRTKYGLAGEYREKPYGFEYRTLSSAWTLHPLSTRIVYEISRAALAWEIDHMIDKLDQNTVKDIINKHDYVAARNFIQENEWFYKKFLMKLTNDEHKYEILNRIILKGFDSFVDTPFEIERNWELDHEHSGVTGRSQNRFSTFIDILYGHAKIKEEIAKYREEKLQGKRTVS